MNPAPDRGDGPACTTDSLLAGRIQFQQPSAGYRVNVDSVLLAAFAASGRRPVRAVDLGAGVGVVSLLLAHFHPPKEVLLVEKDPQLAALAEMNFSQARLAGRVLVRDVATLAQEVALRQTADLVVANPPFFDSERHRPPSDPARETARIGELQPFVRAASALLRGDKARAAFAYPAAALGELFACAAAAQLVAKRLRLVHARIDRAARLALVELRAARAGGLVVEPPLIEWEAPGVMSAELRALNAGT